MEVIVGLAIVGLITGITMSAFSKYSKKEALDSSTAVLAAGLRDARAQTLASVGGSQYGIKISNDQFIFFQGSTYNPASASNTPFYLSGYVRASSSVPTYVFQRLTGNAVASGTIDIYLTSDPPTKRTIVVGSTGLVDIQ
jgi:type II secretory pathway pseudopilin PulG